MLERIGLSQIISNRRGGVRRTILSSMNGVLYKFKAGQVKLDEQTGVATPLRGQGYVVVKESEEDPSLIAIQWQPRGAYMSLKPSEELMVLPGDVEFSSVPECTTGRVISMRFTSSGQRLLYWFQEPPTGDLNQLSEEDEEIILKLNDLASTDVEEEEDVTMAESNI